MDYLYQGLYARGRRVTKQQAFPDMPTRLITEVAITLTKEHSTLYKQLVEEQVLELDDKLIDATKQQRMYQYVQQMLLCPESFADKPIKDNAIFTALDGILDTLGDQKIIVFAWYQGSINKLQETYKAFNPAVINGKVIGTARERAKQKFINDKSCKMLIANALSGGVGLDGFQQVCSYAVFADIYPHPGGFEQAIGRLERSGQTETANIFLLVPKGTIATKLRNDLCRKENTANQAIRDKKTLISEMLGAEGVQGNLI
jgi:ERCC4-related helicase